MVCRLFGASVFLSAVLAVLALAASAADLPLDAPDYNWAQREPSTAPYEPCEPATAFATEATGRVVREFVLPLDAPDYNWAQLEPSLAPYEPCEPATAVVTEVTRPVVAEVCLPLGAPDYNWAQREPSTAPYEPCEPPAHH